MSQLRLPAKVDRNAALDLYKKVQHEKERSVFASDAGCIIPVIVAPNSEHSNNGV